MDKILLIDKPEGMSSYDVIRKIKAKSNLPKKGDGKLRIGHAGTLDPFASGLLVILLGKATKKFNDFQKYHKVYRFTMRFGMATDTLDSTGKIINRCKAPKIDRQDIKTIIDGFVGKQLQTPPKYSAVHINGQRAYKLARDGKDFELPQKEITIYNIKLLSWDKDNPTIELEAEVASGTYIRVLANDIATKLGSCATTVQLRRIAIGPYSVNDAIDVSNTDFQSIFPTAKS